VEEYLTHHPRVEGLNPTTADLTRGQCYKTFYVCNLHIFGIR
jgi:hypothetical protein